MLLTADQEAVRDDQHRDQRHELPGQRDPDEARQ